MSALTMLLFVIGITAAVYFMTLQYMAWEDRRDARRRNKRK
jgi:hypothetical protein